MDDQNIRLNIAGHARYEYAEVARSYVPMHWHGALELIYILSGELTVETEQRRWQLHAGQCIFVSPYVLHSTISLSGSTALLLQIPTEELGDFAPVHLGHGDDESDDDGGHRARETEAAANAAYSQQRFAL